MKRVDPRVVPFLALLPPFVALAVQLTLWSLISPYVWFLFFPAVFISSWIGGLRPGLASTAVSAGLVWFFFVDPRNALAKSSPKALFPLVVFVAMGVLFSVFHERLRTANARTAAALAQASRSNSALLAANTQVVELLDRTRELDKLKTEFFANVSHELRTPLTLILGPTRRLLDSTSVTDVDRTQLDLVERSARQLLRLVNDLLEAATLESREARLQYVETDLAELVRFVTGQFSGLAEDTGITCQVDADVPVRCQVDPDRMQRALTNLLSNAFKFTPPGGTVRVSLTCTNDDAVIEVADSGPGIARQDRQLIFERFRQVEGDERRRFGGTGLGLAIVSDIAVLHHGRVTVGDAPEGGALFQLTVPQRAPLATAVASTTPLVPLEDITAVTEELRAAVPERPDTHQSRGLPSAPDQAVVLVVEDNTDVNRFVCESFAGSYRAESAFDGSSGLAAAEALKPTAIVCDVMMPGMSGEDFLLAVRTSPTLAQTPILMLTAKADDRLRLRLLRAGANDFVTKPFAVEELRARIDNLVRLRLLEQARGRAQARAEGFLEAAPDATVVVDLDGRIVLLNRQAETAFGYAAEELLGQPVEILLPETSRGVHPSLRQAFTQRPRARTMGSGLELSARRKDGSLLPVDVSLSPVHTPDGTLIIAAVRDVSTQRNVQERLRHLALHDALTGLPNRMLLLDRLGQSVAALARQEGCVAVFYVDLDRFKQINDQCGHEVGDTTLVQVAARLLAAVRPQDTVARLGGDEFAVACGNLTDELEALVLAERVEQAVRQPIEVGGTVISPTASVGVALTRSAGTEPEELLRNADTAMYGAKQRGRNRVEVFDEALGRLAKKHFEAERMLREAIDSDRLTLLYQPIIDLVRYSVTGVEALLRLDDPQRGLIAPDDFIATAEETGQIVPIGRWVMREACRQLAAWQSQGHRLQMSVNLSGRQVNHVDLQELVLQATRDTGADPSLLRLEVTETALMHATNEILVSFDKLKNAGVSLAIDDFGTGWSSLTYLKRLPVDVIKIDRTFTQGLGVVADDTAIVTSLVTLGHALGCSITIEGVETVAQLEHAQELGCDHAQGFLFGRPKTADEVLRLIAGQQLPGLPHPRSNRDSRQRTGEYWNTF